MDFLNVCFAFFSCIFVKVILEEDVKELEDHLNLPEVEYLALVSCVMCHVNDMRKKMEDTVSSNAWSFFKAALQ